MNGLANALNALFIAFSVLVIIRVLLSWLPLPPRGAGLRAVLGVLHRATDWFLAPFRRFVPTIGGIDPSPVVAIIALGLARTLVVGTLAGG